MLGKHPEAAEGDDVPGLAELLREAAGPGAAPLTGRGAAYAGCGAL